MEASLNLSTRRDAASEDEFVKLLEVATRAVLRAEEARILLEQHQARHGSHRIPKG